MSNQTGPKITMEPAVYVTIEAPTKASEHIDGPTRDLIGRFLEWQMKTDVHPYRGGGSAPDWLAQWFPAEHADRIAEFFAEEARDD